MSSNKRKFQPKEEDKPPHKIQKMRDSDACEDSTNECEGRKSIDSSENLGTDILEACEKGDVDLVKKLVEEGISVHELDRKGNSCFLIACKYGNLDLVHYLLLNGSSVHEKNYMLDTGLLLASFEGH